jgi:hypothetical protein
VKEQIDEHRLREFVSILWHAGFMLLVVSEAKPCIIRTVRRACMAASYGTKGAILFIDSAAISRPTVVVPIMVQAASRVFFHSLMIVVQGNAERNGPGGVSHADRE